MPPSSLSPWGQSLGRSEQGRVVLVGLTLLVSLLYRNLSPPSVLSIPLRSQGHPVWPHPTDGKAEAQERPTARMSYVFCVFLSVLVFWPSSVLPP